MSVPSVATDPSTYPTGPGVVDEMYYFAAAASAGEVAIVDVSTTTGPAGIALELGRAAKKCTATNDVAYVLGGVLADVAAGTYGLVRKSGAQTGVKCKSTVAAGDALMTSSDAAGRVDTMANTNINKVGAALTSASSNTCTVLWML